MHPPHAGPQADPDPSVIYDRHERRTPLVKAIANYLVSTLRWAAIMRVTFVNAHLAAGWLGYDDESAANVQSEIWMAIHERCVAEIRSLMGRDWGFNIDELRWKQESGLSDEEVADLAMERLSFVTGDEYAAQEGVHQAELEIELVPGERWKLLPQVERVAVGVAAE